MGRDDPLLRTLLPVRRALLLAAGGVLGGLAFLASGWPGAETGSAAALVGLVFVLSLRMGRSGGTGRWLTLLGLALGAAVLGLAAFTQDPFQFSSVQVPWVALVALPLAVIAVQPATDSGRRTPARIALLISLTLGLLAAGPWQETRGRLGLGILALIAMAILTAETFVHMLRRAPTHRRRASVVVPSFPGVLRALLLVALLGLLVTLALVPALSRIPSLYQPPPPEPPASAEPREPRPPTPHEFPPSMDLDTVVARVRRVPDRQARPVRDALYLRERVLDVPRVSEGLVSLVGREDTVTVLRDGQDGARDGDVVVQPHLDAVSADVPDANTVWHEVTLLLEGQERLLLPVRPLRVGVGVLRVAGDGSVARMPSLAVPHSYRVLSDPVDYGGATGNGRSAAVPAATPLPGFAERDALKLRLQPILAGMRDDRQRLRSIARALRNRGLRDGEEQADGHHLPLLEGRVAGTSLQFAQTFCVLARLAGWSSRVAIGYRLPDAEPGVSQDVLVADEHAWAEVQFQGLGWLAFDPTPPPRAPEDPDRPPSEETKPRDPAPDASPSAMTEPIDDTRPPETGLSLEEAAQDADDRTDPTQTLWFVLLGLVVVAATFWLMPQGGSTRSTRRGASTPPRPPRRARKAWRYWQQFLEACARAGVAKDDSVTAREFVRHLQPLMPEDHEPLQLLADTYYDCRFGSAALEAEQERALRRWLSGVAPRLRAAHKAAVTPDDPPHSRR